MWKIDDIIENIHLGSKFEHGMFICAKTEIDNQPIVIYVDVDGKHITIDTEPLLSPTATDDMYNVLYNSLKNGLKGFKIDIKTKRTRKKNNDDDTDIIENNVDDEITTKKTKTKTSTKTKRGRRGRKKKSKSKSE